METTPAPKPVMDVAPPPRAAAALQTPAAKPVVKPAAPASTPAAQPSQQSSITVHQAPKDDDDQPVAPATEPDTTDATQPKHAKPAAPAKPHTPKIASTLPTGVVAATVFGMIALMALTVVVYLKSQ